MDKKDSFLYQVLFTLEYGIQQQIFSTADEINNLLNDAQMGKEITFRHIRFNSDRIISIVLLKKSLITNKFEPLTFVDFEKERMKLQ